MNTQSIAYKPDITYKYSLPQSLLQPAWKKEDREVRACYLGQFQATVWHQGHWITEWSDDERPIGIEITPVTAQDRSVFSLQVFVARPSLVARQM